MIGKIFNKGEDMTNQEYIIKRKLNLVEFAEKMRNISKACKEYGVSRQHFYDIKHTLKTEGVEGLLSKTRKKPNLHNRVSPEIEKILLDYSLKFPTHGQTRASNELLKRGTKISSSGVRSIWLRNNLETKDLRLKRLEKWASENRGILTESQVQALEEQKIEKEAHGEIETHHSGFLLGQDTYYIGYIKGVGKLYQQTGIDTYSNIGFAKIYQDKTALVAADFLNDKVLPFFDDHGINLLRVLTDRGKEYIGSSSTHAYQLYLQLNDIEHSKTKVRSPQSNGCTEKLNQTIQEEFYNVAFRKKLYKSIEEIQIDLDDFMKFYNEKRTNQGKRCKGRTPMETFHEGVEKYYQLVFDSKDEASDLALQKNGQIQEAVEEEKFQIN